MCVPFLYGKQPNTVAIRFFENSIDLSHDMFCYRYYSDVPNTHVVSIFMSAPLIIIQNVRSIKGSMMIVVPRHRLHSLNETTAYES